MKSIIAMLIALIAMVGIGAAATDSGAIAISAALDAMNLENKVSISSDADGYLVTVIDDSPITALAAGVGITAAQMAYDDDKGALAMIGAAKHNADSMLVYTMTNADANYIISLTGRSDNKLGEHILDGISTMKL
jgi:hypothetical protein